MVTYVTQLVVEPPEFGGIGGVGSWEKSLVKNRIPYYWPAQAGVGKSKDFRAEQSELSFGRVTGEIL